MSENKNEIPKNVLHGVTLEAILIDLVEYVGWEKMASKIPIRCFEFDPSIKSALTFLRKTPWARQKVEVMYTFHWKKIQRGKELKSNNSYQ
jgi:uncharacterized protein (DUF2132 family)